MAGQVDARNIGYLLHQSNPLLIRRRTEGRQRLFQSFGRSRRSEDLTPSLAPQCLKQRACDIAHVTHLLQHLLEVRAERSVFIPFLQEDLYAAGHDRHRIVEFVHEAGSELTQQRELVRQPGLLVRGGQFLTQACRSIPHVLQLQLQLFRLFPCTSRLGERVNPLAAGKQEGRKRRQATSGHQDQAGGQGRGRKHPSQDPAERQDPDPAEPEQIALPGIRAIRRIASALLFEHRGRPLRSRCILTRSLRQHLRSRRELMSQRLLPQDHELCPRWAPRIPVPGAIATIDPSHRVQVTLCPVTPESEN